jgi:hypothetical protein
MLYEISSVVDITHLQCIPSSYQEALSKSSNIIESILKIGVSDYNPEKVVERLDETLRIINKKVVVVIEDIDRNPNPKESLLKIEPLLERLRKSNQIRFILTISKAEEVDQEINRIIDNKITLVLNEKHRLSIFKRFRTLLLNKFDNIFIDTYRKEERNQQWSNFYFENRTADKPSYLTSHDKDGRIKYKFQKQNAYIYICGLINTPRKIKRMFFETYKIWNILQGEIELDDLIFLTAIKTTNFAVYKKTLDRCLFSIGSENIEQITSDGGFNDPSIEEPLSAAISWVILERTIIKETRQPFFLMRYIERIQTLEIDKFSDQKLLKLGKDYFEDGTNTASETFKIIEENVLHERLLPLWRKYIYPDKEINGLSIATSDDLFNKIKLLLIEMIAIFLKKNNPLSSNYKIFATILHIALNGTTQENRNTRLEPIIEKLFLLSFIKNGLGKLKSILFCVTNDTPQYIKYFEKKANENKDLVQTLIENNDFDIINTFLSSFPTFQDRIEFDEEKRQLFAWLLDGILSLAKTGDKKAIQMIYYLIVAQYLYIFQCPLI